MTEPRLISVPAWMHPQARAEKAWRPQMLLLSHDVYFLDENGTTRFVDRLTPVLVERGELERARG